MPPTYKFLPIPAPPAVITAPDVTLVDWVESVEVTIPPTYNRPPILAPPLLATTNAPVPSAVAAVFEVSVTVLEKVAAPDAVSVVTAAVLGVVVPKRPFIPVPASRLATVAVPVAVMSVNVAGAVPKGPTVRQAGPPLGPT